MDVLWILKVVMVLTIGVSVVCTHPDSTICNETVSNHSGPPLPVLPELFSVRVEVNILTKNSTLDVQEWHDGPGNRGAANMWAAGQPLNFVYSYSSGELFNIEQLTGGRYRCTVKDLNTVDQPYLHGTDTVDNHTRIYSAARALSFGGCAYQSWHSGCKYSTDYIRQHCAKYKITVVTPFMNHFITGSLQEHYIGRSTARGILTDVWRACVYWPDTKATMSVEWHFTVKGEWDSAVGVSQTPVRCHVKGTTGADGNGRLRPFEHLYEVTDFRYYLEDETSVFETPAGTACIGRKNVKPLPVPPDSFSYSAELVEMQQQYTQYIKKAYDRNLRLAMIEFVSASSPRSTLRMIDDFNTGARYILDLIHGNCTVATIDHAAFDALPVSPSMLRMRTPGEFFRSGTVCSYEGVCEWSVTTALASTNGSVPVAVSVSLDLQNLDYRADCIVVSTVLTDAVRPSIPVLSDPLTEVNLVTAVTRLQTAVTSRAFSVTFSTKTVTLLSVFNGIHQGCDGLQNVGLGPFAFTGPCSHGCLDISVASIYKAAKTSLLCTSDTLLASSNNVTAPASERDTDEVVSVSTATSLRSVQVDGPQNPPLSSHQSGQRIIVCSERHTGYSPGDVAAVSVGAAFSSYLLVFGGLSVWTKWWYRSSYYQRDRMELS